ncbi:MAG: SPOR domain-containing protein [Fimbriimonadales bacterium]|nr:SPOR domain-containing protein [Fimbriimonadales bacterium]
MPLDFRNHEEGFSIKRFLKTVGAGVAVFLVFLAVGYYFVGPRITVSESGRVQLRLSNANASAPASEVAPTNAEKPMPKVDVYEKLSPEVTAGSGVIVGSREVAPFDYERYQQKRRERRSKPQETPAPAETPPPLEDEYFVPDASDSGDTPVSSEPVEPETPAPTQPQPTEPPQSPPAQPTTPTETETHENARYRVQVGVYESRENANQVAQRLLASGYEASIIPFQRDGKTVYRVQTLVTSDKAKADSLKSQLESQGFPAVVAKVK